MKILVTGGVLIHRRAARTLAARPEAPGRCAHRATRACRSVAAAGRPGSRSAGRVPRQRLLAQSEAGGERFDGVFHLASAVGRMRPTSTSACAPTWIRRALLDALRAQASLPARRRRGWCSSSVAVFGPDPASTLPALVGDTTLPTPKTSYGTHKLVRAPDRRLLAQGLRRRPLGASDDGHCAPGGPTAQRVVVLLRDHPRAAGRAGVGLSGGALGVAPAHVGGAHGRGLIAVFEASAEALRQPPRAEPAGAERARVGHAGRARGRGRTRVRARVRFERDPVIAGIVANWPAGAMPSAARLACGRTPTSRTSSASTSRTAAPPDGGRTALADPRRRIGSLRG